VQRVGTARQRNHRCGPFKCQIWLFLDYFCNCGLVLAEQHVNFADSKLSMLYLLKSKRKSEIRSEAGSTQVN
jgi:hypothetical protein